MTNAAIESTQETGVSVVIPNYNGAQLLEENLPSVVAAFREWGGSYELIVVDDASTDGSCHLLRERFPEVTLLSCHCYSSDCYLRTALLLWL